MVIPNTFRVDASTILAQLSTLGLLPLQDIL